MYLETIALHFNTGRCQNVSKLSMETNEVDPNRSAICQFQGVPRNLKMSNEHLIEQDTSPFASAKKCIRHNFNRMQHDT